MGERAAIIDAEDRSRVVGHIDASAVHYGECRGTIVGTAATQLKELLGQGYGRRKFHILLPAFKLESCQIVSPHVVFTYENAHHLDLDEAPPTYPEHLVPDDIFDEETPCDDGLRR